MKVKSNCTAKQNTSKVNRQTTEEKRIFTSYSSDRDLISRLFKKKKKNLKKLSNKNNQSALSKKWNRQMNREVSQEEIQMVCEHIKRCPASLAIMGLSISLWSEWLPFKSQMATNVSKGVMKEEQIVQPLWKSICMFLKKPKTKSMI